MFYKSHLYFFTALVFAVFILSAQEMDTPLIFPDLSHLERNPTFAEWEGETPTGWITGNLGVFKTDEVIEGYNVVELKDGKRSSAFGIKSPELAAYLRAGDILNFEISIKTETPEAVEIYYGFGRTKGEKEEWTSIGNTCPLVKTWQRVGITWTADKDTLYKDSPLSNIVIGIRYRGNGPYMPIRVCKPQISVVNPGL